MTSSKGNIFRVTGHLCGNSSVPGEFPTQRPVTRSFEVSLICVWINNREAGDLRRYRAHYDVIVMCWLFIVHFDRGCHVKSWSVWCPRIGHSHNSKMVSKMTTKNTEISPTLSFCSNLDDNLIRAKNNNQIPYCPYKEHSALRHYRGRFYSVPFVRHRGAYSVLLTHDNSCKPTPVKQTVLAAIVILNNICHVWTMYLCMDSVKFL